MLRIGRILIFIRVKRRFLGVLFWLVEYRRRKLVVPQKCIIWSGRNRETGRVNGLGKFRVPISKGDVESKIENLGVSKKFWCRRQLGIKCRIIGSFFADGDHF